MAVIMPLSGRPAIPVPRLLVHISQIARIYMTRGTALRLDDYTDRITIDTMISIAADNLF